MSGETPRIEHSLLAAQLWDLRSSLEKQLRQLTAAQHLHLDYLRETDKHERARLKARIVRELADVLTLNRVITETLTETQKRAEEELDKDKNRDQV